MEEKMIKLRKRNYCAFCNSENNLKEFVETGSKARIVICEKCIESRGKNTEDVMAKEEVLN